ncbi:ABC transporter ATP-binding protein/permease [Methylorubrum extorquens]
MPSLASSYCGRLGNFMRRVKRLVLPVWRLAYPYFTATDTVSRPVPLRPMRIQERWIALGLASLIFGIELFKVTATVRLSYFNRDWFDAIQNKDEGAFWSQLLHVFLVWSLIYVTLSVSQYVIMSVLQIRWRTWMTKGYVDRWLGDHTHYRIGLLSSPGDNPDQRIAEDIDKFTRTTQSLTVQFLSSVSNLISFSVILWSISASFTVPGTNWHVPGFLVWGAVIYVGFVTWLTHVIGRALVGLNFHQQRREADFRFSLARLREYGEQVSLLGGGEAEKDGLIRGRFKPLVKNFYAIINVRKRLMAFIVGYEQAATVIPYIFSATYYFSGQITLGTLTQVADAFLRLQMTLSFFITNYTDLTAYKAEVDRLTSFGEDMDRADAMRALAAPVVAAGDSRALSVRGLALKLPDGRRIASVPDLLLHPGEAVLLKGPSGSGKSTLFRAIAGIWPFCEGRIQIPAGATLLLLPQRPYIPIGSLRYAATYPQVLARHGGDEIDRALRLARLPHLIERLDEEAAWAQTLTLGEQQRLAIARALLAKPDWLFLDEATAALDEPTEAALYTMLREQLPATTLVSIGHRATLQGFHERCLDMRPSSDGTFTLTNARRQATAGALSEP